MRTVLVPRAGGVLSALGLAISDIRRDYVNPYLSPLEEVDADEFERRFAQMESTADEELTDPEHTRRADLRYRGQSFELTVEAELDNPHSETNQEVVSLMFEAARVMAIEARGEPARAV